MFESWTPVHSGLAGAIIAGLLTAWAARQKPEIRGGLYVLDYAPVMRAILLVSGVVLPIVMILGIPEIILPIIGNPDVDFNGMLVAAIVIPVGIALAIVSPYVAYRTLVESVTFDSEGFHQERSLPKWGRYVRWSDIEHFGYVSWLQLHWLKPKIGPGFWYFDGMRGLPEFNSQIRRQFFGETDEETPDAI